MILFHPIAKPKKTIIKVSVYLTPVLNSTPTLHTPAKATDWLDLEASLEASLFGKVQIITQPSARLHPRNVQARRTISQRREEAEAPESRAQDNQGRDPSGDERLAAHAFVGVHEAPAGFAGWVFRVARDASAVEGLDVEDEFDQSASDECGC